MFVMREAIWRRLVLAVDVCWQICRPKTSHKVSMTGWFRSGIYLGTQCMQRQEVRSTWSRLNLAWRLGHTLFKTDELRNFMIKPQDILPVLGRVTVPGDIVACHFCVTYRQADAVAFTGSQPNQVTEQAVSFGETGNVTVQLCCPQMTLSCAMICFGAAANNCALSSASLFLVAVTPLVIGPLSPSVGITWTRKPGRVSTVSFVHALYSDTSGSFAVCIAISFKPTVRL